MITPLDIQNKEFTKGMRGYKEEEVDGFLDLLTMDFEKLLEENHHQKDQIRALNLELERYKTSEGAILDTLESAKSLMNDISASAEKRADVLLKNAELDAEVIVREAKATAELLEKENCAIKNQYLKFRSDFRLLLEKELEKLDAVSADLFDADSSGTLQEIQEMFGEDWADGDGESISYLDPKLAEEKSMPAEPKVDFGAIFVQRMGKTEGNAAYTEEDASEMKTTRVPVQE